MSRICAVNGCNKRPGVANNVSHAHNKTKRWIYPNVHTMRYSYTNDPERLVHRGAVCTKCLKAGIVKKVI